MSDTLKVTSRCGYCHQPTHLVQDSAGSMWMHDKLIDEHTCWTEHRVSYELAAHTLAAIDKILGA